MGSAPPLRTIGSVSTKSVLVDSRVLYVGPVALQPGDEYPAGIEFPSEMRMAVHDLIGGGRNVQPMGLSLDDVEWTGEMIGPDVETRVLLFERMEASGLVQRLKWLYHRLDVVVKKFRPRYLHENRVQYTITLQVVRDAANRYAGTAAASVSGSTSALSTAAGTLSGQTTYPDDTAQAAAQANAAQAAANPAGVPGGFSVANVAKYAGLAARAAAVLNNRPTSVLGLVQAAGALSAAVATVLPTVPNPVGQATGNTAGFLADMTTTIKLASAYVAAATPLLNVVVPGCATVTYASLVNASQLLYTIQLIKQNVAVGQAPLSVVCRTGTSFEELASRYYGDVSFAGQLRRANGSVASVVRPGTTVKLFPFQTNTTVPSVRTAAA